MTFTAWSKSALVWPAEMQKRALDRITEVAGNPTTTTATPLFKHSRENAASLAGKYTITGPVTLLEVIADAGSLTPTAGPILTVQRYRDGLAAAAAAALEPTLPGDPLGVELLRIPYDDLKEGRLKANILLQDGDTIFVPAADRFYVSGFVKTPGMFVLAPGLTVQQAISLAGGTTERGSTRGIKISRKVNGKYVEISVGLSDLVKPNDTIKVRQRLI